VEECLWKRRDIEIAALCKYNLRARLHLLSGGLSWKANVLPGEALPVTLGHLTLPEAPAVASLLVAILQKGVRCRGTIILSAWDSTLLFVLPFGEDCGVE
jgi:hypothetical protein